MLAKEPERRYKNARELLQDLRYVQQSNSHPELVLPSWAPEPLWKRILIPVFASMLGAALLLGAFESSAIRRWISPEPPLKRKFLAVLPFTTLATDPERRAFTDGVGETLAMRLTQLTATYPVEVVPPRELHAKSVADAEQARKLFGANLALEGSLAQSDHLIRVSYSLVDTATRRQVRADSVTVSDQSGALLLEDRLVESVMTVLGMELKPNDRALLHASDTAEPAAYDDYLRGRGFLQDNLKTASLDTAIGLFQSALEKDKGYSQASAALGEAYWFKYSDTGDQQWAHRSQESCQLAETQADNLPGGHICLGVVYNGTGKYEDAVQEFQKALSLDSTNDDAFRGLAFAYEKLNRPDDAERTFRKAIELRPRYWAGCAWLGGFYFRHGRYDEAARMYSEWIALSPDNYLGYSDLGAVYVEQGRYSEAIPQFQRSVDINPTVDGYGNLATVYFYQGDFADAVREYKQAIEIRGAASDSHTELGNLAEAYYWLPDQREQAKELYRQAIALGEKFLKVNPRDAAGMSYVGLYHAMLMERGPAQSYSQRALQLAPDDLDVSLNAAKIAAQLGDKAGALAAIAHARKSGVSPFVVRDDPVFRPLASDLQFQKLATP